MEGADIEQLICDRFDERLEVIEEKLECDENIISTRTAKFNFLSNEKSNRAVEELLEVLSDPVDITYAFFALAKSSFGQHLEVRRKLAWLPEVLQVLRKRELIFDLNSDGKQRINCLGLRGVSKSCKEIADSVFFESSFLDPSWYMHIDYASDWREKLFRDRSQFTHWNVNNADVTVLVQNSQVDRVLEYFPCQNDVSPSLFRKLYVDHKSYYQEENAVDRWAFIRSVPKLWQSHSQSLDKIWSFEQKLMEFLHVHGSSVWFFVYNPTLLPDTTQYIQLYDLIARMPNLRGLAVLNPKGVYLANNIVCPPPADTTFPFAGSSGSLEYLRCDADMRQINIFDVLSNCNINIKNLKMDQYKLLGSLSLESYTNTVNLFLDRFDRFYKPPLKSLTLENFNYNGNNAVSMPYLCEVLNRFGDTLTDLTIYAYISRSSNKSCKFNLPQLKRLKLWDNDFGQDGSLCFDHLVLLKSLEKIRIEMDLHGYTEDRHTPSDSVEIQAFQGKLHRSDIWKIFPNLKEVEFRDSCCEYVEALDYSTRHVFIGCFPHKKKEVRYVREGNNVTRFKTREWGNGFRQTEHKLGGQSRCSIV